MITRGQVTEVLPDLKYRVRFPHAHKDRDTIGDKEVICYLSGKMKLHKIKVLVGDTVEVILDEYGGKATNRITHLLAFASFSDVASRSAPRP